MAVKSYGEIYVCNICGNKVEVIESGGGTLVCCGREMEIVDEPEQSSVNLPDVGG